MLHTLDSLELADLAEIVYIDVDDSGRPRLDQLEEQLAGSDKKTLVSLMHANNEINTFAVSCLLWACLMLFPSICED